MSTQIDNHSKNPEERRQEIIDKNEALHAISQTANIVNTYSGSKKTSSLIGKAFFNATANQAQEQITSASISLTNKQLKEEGLAELTTEEKESFSFSNPVNNSINSAVSSVVDSISSAVSSIANTVSEAFSSAMDSISNAFSPDSRDAAQQGNSHQSTASHTQDQTDSIDRETNADASKTDQRAAEPARNPHADHGYGSNWGNDNSGDAQSENQGGYGDDEDCHNDSGDMCSWPIVLDLGGDGVKLTAIEGSNAFYDFTEEEYRQHTGWASKDDAFLALDFNNDGKIQGKWELAFAEWGNKAIEKSSYSPCSFSLLAQRKRSTKSVLALNERQRVISATAFEWLASKRNGTPMSTDGFSKAFLLGEGQLTKATLAQTVPHLYRSNTHKISSPPIRGKEDILKVA